VPQRSRMMLVCFWGGQDGKLPLDEALAEGLRDSVDILMTSMGAGPVRWDAHESVLHAAARVGSPALCSMIVAGQPQLRRAQARVRARTLILIAVDTPRIP
jgi:hypothetical protein